MPRSVGSRLQASTRSKSPVWRVAVPVVALAAGALFGVSSHASDGTDLRSGETDLAGVVAGADHRVKVKQRELARVRRDVDSRQRRAASADGAGSQADRLNRQADQSAATAGLTPMTGPGLTVTLNDSKETVDELPEGGTPDWLVVHQQDVQSVVNALWRGGAKGMMLMDQRVVSTSAVRCVGNTLILQGRVYSPPFKITAVGDPSALTSALDNDDSVKIYKQYVDAVGLGYDVKRSDHTTLPAYSGSLVPQHARVEN